jgi:glycosyltransferase involved in cell wall biosynthesis
MIAESRSARQAKGSAPMFESRARITVVIPSYQATQSIQRVIAGIPLFVSQVIVVDDGGSDDTAAVVARSAADDPRLVLIRHAVNQGVGGAMLTGYNKAFVAICRRRRNGRKRAASPRTP